MSEDFKPLKSFWEKPQGKLGMVGLGLAIFGVGYVLLKNAAWIMAAMANLTTAVFMGIGLFALLWLLSDKQFRMVIWYLYKGAIEKLTSIFIEIDPIGIMKTYVRELKNKRKEMNNQLLKLKGEIGKLDRKIKTNTTEINTLITKASAASKSTDARLKARTTLNARKASRRQKSTIKLADLLSKIKALYEKMDKMYYYSGIMIEDVDDQVDMIETERKAIHASYGVMKRAQSIIAGNSNEAEMFDRALEHVADDLGSKLGEMDRFMDISQNFIDGVDLDNEVFEMEGLAMLEEWENDNSLDFLNQGSTDYLEVIGSKMNSSEEPVLLDRQVEFKEPLKQKKLGKKDFFD